MKISRKNKNKQLIIVKPTVKMEIINRKRVHDLSIDWRLKSCSSPYSFSRVQIHNTQIKKKGIDDKMMTTCAIYIDKSGTRDMLVGFTSSTG